MRGLGAPLRSMCMWSGTSFIAKCHQMPADGDYLGAKWFLEDKPKLKDMNPMINLPYIIDGDMVITQTNACMSHLGRKLGLWGTSTVEISQCEQLLCEIYDLRSDMTRMAYDKNFETEAARKVVNRQKKKTICPSWRRGWNSTPCLAKALHFWLEDTPRPPIFICLRY